MNERWAEFLDAAPAAGHAVEIYTSVDALAESVGAYLTNGFERGDPAILVATPEHLGAFFSNLGARGWERDRLDAGGLLIEADAASTLDTFMVGGRPAPDAFERAVGGLIDEAAARRPGNRPRVFGEMVDVLCRRGQPAAAIALEELWNELARTREFALLCGYELDLFDRTLQAGTLQAVCDVHSHVLPAHDSLRLARAVDSALEDVLGPTEAGKVYVVVADELRAARVPAPQLVMMWVSENMPHAAERILAAARARYAELPPTPPSESGAVGAAPHVDRDASWIAMLRRATRTRPNPFFRSNDD